MQHLRAPRSKTMRWGLILFAAGVYSATLIATAPATLAAAPLQRESNGLLRLVNAKGTLWAGSGQIELSDSNGRVGMAIPITWQLQPASLILARLAFEVTVEPQSKPARVTLSRSGVEVKSFAVRLPAMALGLAVPGLAPLGLMGEMLFHADALNISQSKLWGAAIVQWRAAGSTLTPIYPLGDYEIQVNGNGTTIAASLRTIGTEAALRIEGSSTWKVGSKPALLATATVSPQQRLQLAPVLRMIAVERNSGTFEIQLQ